MEANSLPSLFLERLQTILSLSDYQSVIDTFYHDKKVCFRINTLKTNLNEIYGPLTQEFDLEKVNWFENAFIVPSAQREKLTHSELFTSGKIYIQNLSSMIPPLVLNPNSQDRVLDLTAAPGSKTSLLSALMQNQGDLAAVEVSRDRFFKMVSNLKLLGATNVKTFLKDGEFVWKATPEKFDKVLVDAPCSTESRFHISDPETYQYWSLKKIKEMVKKQSRLLYSGIQCLKPGGELVYSTCSFSPEENEEVVDRILSKFGEKIILENIEISLDNVRPGLVVFNHKQFSPELVKSKRILPNHAMEGFFLCKIKKLESTLEPTGNHRAKF